MNTNPNAKRILAFGDSNTWGCIPSAEHNSRYTTSQRWTGLLQTLLGNDYEVIEEGLNGRSTCLNDPKPGRKDKNGLDYLLPCLKSQDPLDLVILMLGTNDLKERFNQRAEDIGNNIQKLIKVILDPASYETGKVPKLILLSPTIVDDQNPLANSYPNATPISKQLGEIFKNAAQTFNLPFVDLASLVLPSKTDGLHLEPESHQIIASTLQKLVTDLI